MDLRSHHISGFSPDSAYFALINDQGILKIWDTETNELKQEFVPNLHLAAPCTCLVWTTVSQRKKKNRSNDSRRSSLGDGGGQVFYLALGTSKGGVVMYSLATGKIDRELKGEGHTARVTNIAYDNKNLLYTCGEDSQILVWNVAEEKQIAGWSIGNEKPYSIATLPESNCILVGGRQLKLYHVGEQKLRQVFTGHTSDVTLLKHFSYSDTDYVISTSKMERILCLWTVTNRSKNKNPSCTFLMENIAYFVSCNVDGDGNLRVAAVTRSGVVHVYVNALGSLKPDKPIKPKVTIQIAAEDTDPIAPIHAMAGLLEKSTNNKILLGYGDKQFLRFESIEPNFTEKVQVFVRADPKSLSSKKHKKKLEGSLKHVTPIVDFSQVEYQSSAAINRKSKKSVQIPMETRLQNLNLENGEIPTAQSKVQLLTQALQSKDANLLRNVLVTQDEQVVQLTLKRLPIQYVSALLNELTQMMQQKRSNVKAALCWLKYLVKIHASQLMAFGSDELFEKFGPILGIIEHRMLCLQEFSKLSGQLDLLINQIQRNTEEDAMNEENVLVYKDEDSANSDVDDDAQVLSDDQSLENDSEEEMDVN